MVRPGTAAEGRCQGELAERCRACDRAAGEPEGGRPGAQELGAAKGSEQRTERADGAVQPQVAAAQVRGGATGDDGAASCGRGDLAERPYAHGAAIAQDGRGQAGH